jgi:hypothetical protein
MFIWLRDHLIDNAMAMAAENAGIPEEDFYIHSVKCNLKRTAAQNWNREIRKTKSEYVCMLGDDTLPQPNYLKNALEAMEKIGWGMVNFNDGTNTDRTSHILVSLKMIDEVFGGELIHEGYTFCCSDMEYMERAKEAGRYVFAPKSIVIHAHPMLMAGVPSDKFYEKAYSPHDRMRDQRLYQLRKENGWH